MPLPIYTVELGKLFSSNPPLNITSPGVHDQPQLSTLAHIPSPVHILTRAIYHLDGAQLLHSFFGIFGWLLTFHLGQPLRYHQPSFDILTQLFNLVRNTFHSHIMLQEGFSN